MLLRVYVGKVYTRVITSSTASCPTFFLYTFPMCINMQVLLQGKVIHDIQVYLRNIGFTLNTLHTAARKVASTSLYDMHVLYI